jgi:hypothetical protein
LYIAAKLGVADLLRDGLVNCELLATKTTTHPQALYRTLRALASVGVFTEVEPQRFALTPLAALLQSGTANSMRALAIMYAEEQYSAWGELLYSVQTGEPSFEQKFGMGVFDYFAQNPRAGAVFNEAMTGLTSQVADALADTYDFSRFETIIDIGANLGTVIAAILRRYPNSRGILFDRPAVVASAARHLTEAGVENRCQRLGGDFFTGVPSGGDVYLLASILHDWDDARSLAILRQCRQVMAAHAKLLVVELVVPEGDAPHPAKWVDLHMLVMASGRERTEAQYRSLLHAAGLKLASVWPIPGGQSVLEAVPN